MKINTLRTLPERKWCWCMRCHSLTMRLLVFFLYKVLWIFFSGDF